MSFERGLGREESLACWAGVRTAKMAGYVPAQRVGVGSCAAPGNAVVVVVVIVCIEKA